MEIIGLAIVIILITLAMIFVVRFVVIKKPAEFKKAFTQTELASNMVNTFLKTTSRDCNGLSMTELLQDCAQSQAIYCENGMVSCRYVNETASLVFADTLESWNIGYEFKAYLEEQNPILGQGKACIGEKKSKLFPIPTAARTLYVKLDICG